MHERELILKIDEIEIKARKTEVRGQNLAAKFLETFKSKLAEMQNDIEVYNLTINGNGRFYFIPGLDFIAMYLLGDFETSNDVSKYTPVLNLILAKQ